MYVEGQLFQKDTIGIANFKYVFKLSIFGIGAKLQAVLSFEWSDHWIAY